MTIVYSGRTVIRKTKLGLKSPFEGIKLFNYFKIVLVGATQKLIRNMIGNGCFI